MHFRIEKNIEAHKNWNNGRLFANIALYYELNNAWIQSQFSFRRPLPNDFRFKLDVVCEVILIFKDILRLRNKGPFIIYTSGGHRREIGWVTDFWNL